MRRFYSILKRPTVYNTDKTVSLLPHSHPTAKQPSGTHGRGNKGYKARSGKNRPVPAFEGGQTGLLKAFPKIGSSYQFQKKYVQISLDQLQFWIHSNRLDSTQIITVKTLVDAGCLSPTPLVDGIELIPQGKLSFPISLQVQRADPTAIAAIESAGGNIQTVYYSKQDLHIFLSPQSYLDYPTQPALPTRPADILYYTNPAVRGYLSSTDPDTQQKLAQFYYS